MSKFSLISFPYFKDFRGETVPFELDNKFPFKVKRVYLVTGNTQQNRGGHAHILETELFICISGSLTAVVHDGEDESRVFLSDKSKGLLIYPLCWHEFCDFSKETILLCFSSTHYIPDETNYIYDKNKFLQEFIIK